MTNVWVVVYEDLGDGTESILGVYSEFENAAHYALGCAHEQVQEYKTHTEAKVKIEMNTADGVATYIVKGCYGENPFYPWDVYEVRRHVLR